jgi:hypothetical protein
VRPILIFVLLTAGSAFALVEPPLPAWDASEREEMIEAGWIAGDLVLSMDLPESEGDEVAGLPPGLEDPLPDELAVSPEEEEMVGEEYISDYFAEKPDTYLVDPQGLLTTLEENDLDAFLKYHAGDSSIEMYVYVFGADQYIPSDVREEEVAERLYSEGKPAAVVYYYIGAPQRSAIHLSPVITDTVSASEQRRALGSSVMQAAGTTKPFDQVMAFLDQMSIRIYWMERMAEGTAVETLEAIPDGEKPRPSPEKTLVAEEPMEIPSWAITAGAAVGGGIVVLLALWGAVIWWRSRARFRFPEFEVEPRLGGNHAAGIGAVISFSSSAIPPAMQRNQVPDYMRRA